MNFLNNLPKSTIKPSKRLGRGYGSGKGGHTSSSGQKGQNSRSGGNVGPFFEGTKKNKDFFRRTPWLRGKNRLKTNQKDSVILKLSQLDVFKDGDKIDAKALIKAGLITEGNILSMGVKILFDKKIEKKLDIQVPASKSVLESVK